MKSIKQIIKSEKVDMGGIILDQPLPNKFMDQIDPFLLIHHWDDELKGGKQQKEIGVGPHPHRGFVPQLPRAEEEADERADRRDGDASREDRPRRDDG